MIILSIKLIIKLKYEKYKLLAKLYNSSITDQRFNPKLILKLYF